MCQSIKVERPTERIKLTIGDFVVMFMRSLISDAIAPVDVEIDVVVEFSTSSRAA